MQDVDLLTTIQDLIESVREQIDDRTANVIIMWDDPASLVPLDAYNTLLHYYILTDATLRYSILV